MKTEQFKINKMGCVNCSKTIQNTLNDLNGIENATVNFGEKYADVTYDDTIVSKEIMRDAVSDKGYQLIID